MSFEKPIVIGLAGYARSGKDTVADRLVEQHGFVKVRFAAGLKRGLATMLGLTEAELEGSEKESVIPWLGCSPRHLMQTLGTEWGRRMIHPDLWVKATEQHLKRLVDAGCRRIVISDVRFENEAKLVKYLGVLVRVDRPGFGPANGHVSEDAAALEPYLDAVLVNDGSLEDLEDRVIDLVVSCRIHAGQAAKPEPHHG